MGPLIRLVLFLGDALIAVYVLLATASFVYGLARFLFAAPEAIRKDLERWWEERAGPARMLRHVDNEAEFGPAALPPAPDDPHE